MAASERLGPGRSGMEKYRQAPGQGGRSATGVMTCRLPLQGNDGCVPRGSPTPPATIREAIAGAPLRGAAIVVIEPVAGPPGARGLSTFGRQENRHSPALTMVGLRRVVHFWPPARARGTPALPGDPPEGGSKRIGEVPGRPLARGSTVRVRQRNRRGIRESFAKNLIAASPLSDPRAARCRRSRPRAESFHSISSTAPAGGVPGCAVAVST